MMSAIAAIGSWFLPWEKTKQEKIREPVQFIRAFLDCNFPCLFRRKYRKDDEEIIVLYTLVGDNEGWTPYQVISVEALGDGKFLTKVGYPLYLFRDNWEQVKEYEAQREPIEKVPGYTRVYNVSTFSVGGNQFDAVEV